MNNTILIIEDQFEIKENIVELLTLAGYITYSAVNGKQGLEMATKIKPDLILCDIMMPELDGYGVLRAIENLPELCGTPFIFLTAKNKPRDFRTGMDLGADDYMCKPFTGEQLLKIVSARLKKKQTIICNLEKSSKDLNEKVPISDTMADMITRFENKAVKKLRKKGMLFMEGDYANYIYYLTSGKIKTYKTNEYGKDYITEIYKQGDYFGYTAFFDDGVHKESGVAIENSEVTLIPKLDFITLLHSNPRISMELIRQLSNNYSDAEEKLLHLAYNSARKRVAEALLLVSRKYNDDSKVEPTFSLQRENISALAGISPESVSRNLSEFKEEGLIRTENGNITIIDIKKLQSLKN